MNKLEKAAYMDRVLMNVLYDVSRLCYLAKHIDFYNLIQDYRKIHEHDMLKERLGRLFQACGTLSPSELEMLYLRYERGLKYQQIGRKMYMSKVTAYDKMRRTLVELYTAIYEE